MPQTDPKTIKAQLRKGELKNLYYIYTVDYYTTIKMNYCLSQQHE